MTPELFAYFKGYVGLSFQTSGDTESGLYVDQLPDVSERDIEKLRTSDAEADVNDTWEEIERRAIGRLYSHFAREIRNTHKVNDTQKMECLMQKYKAALAFPLQYALGAEVMHTRLRSSRLNTYTSLDGREKAREMEEEFVARMEDELRDAVTSIDIHNSGCFDCDEQPGPNDLLTFVPPII